MPHPPIIVIIPAHNAENTLPRSIASLNANTEPHDIVVVDDGSKTPVSSYLTPQPNLIVIRLETNQGPSVARNTALKHAVDKGYTYVAQLDADDIAAPMRLTRQKAFLDKHPEIVLLGSFARVVSEDGLPLYYVNLPTDDKSIRKGLFYNNCLFNPSLMYRTVSVKAGIAYDPRYRSAQDYDFVRKLIKLGKVASLPEYLIDYTQSSTGITHTKTQQQMLFRIQIQLQYFDLLSPSSYLGFLKTTAQYFVRYSLSFLKKPPRLRILSEEKADKNEATPTYQWHPISGFVKIAPSQGR